MGTFAANSSECEEGLHVMPHNDEVAHEPEEDCVCGPTWTPAPHGDHVHSIWQHHALDGRA